MQEDDDGGLSIFDEFFTSIAPFSPNASVIDSTNEEQYSTGDGIPEVELSIEADVAAVVENMITEIIENIYKTQLQVPLNTSTDFLTSGEFEHQLLETEDPIVEKATKIDKYTEQTPPQTHNYSDDIFINGFEHQLMETEEGFNNVSVQDLSDTLVGSNVSPATLNLINYVKTRKSFSKPHKNQPSIQQLVENVVKERIDVTTPEVIIDSIFFLGGFTSNNNQSKFRTSSLKPEIPTGNNTISASVPVNTSHAAIERTTIETVKTAEVVVETETLQNAGKTLLSRSPVSMQIQDIDAEFFTNLSIHIQALENELKTGKERCAKVQEILLEQSKFNDGNLQMLKTMENCLSSLKLSIAEKDGGIKCNMIPVQSESASESSVILITDSEQDPPGVPDPSSSDQDLSESSENRRSVPKSAQKKIIGAHSAKPISGAALRRKHVINEVKKGVEANVQQTGPMRLRKRQATLTSEGMAYGTVRKKRTIAPLTIENVEPTRIADEISASDEGIRSWYWSPQQPTRAEIRKTMSSTNNQVHPVTTTLVDASKVNCTFKSMDLFNKCPYCWAADHCADDCNVYPLLEQRERACEVMMLCRKCIAMHPNRACRDDRNWSCLYCGEVNHDLSLCKSAFHRAKCQRIYDQARKKGLDPLEQLVKINWHETL